MGTLSAHYEQLTFEIICACAFFNKVRELKGGTLEVEKFGSIEAPGLKSRIMEGWKSIDGSIEGLKLVDGSMEVYP